MTSTNARKGLKTWGMEIVRHLNSPFSGS
uniref:Ubiquitin carboxyl-terminal hydrolase 12 isoform X2 n=1 Tax=Rhizophora mucronata TaxID=61149 RepID=A0A2P2MFP8_RHIMU